MASQIEQDRPARVKAWRDRAAAVAHDLAALNDLFLTIGVYGAAVVLAFAWLGLAVRAFLFTAGLFGF